MFSCCQCCFRNHHCRHCGRVCCKRCSSHTAELPKFGLATPQRLCDLCYDVLQCDAVQTRAGVYSHNQ